MSTETHTPPDFPAGPFQPEDPSEEARTRLIDTLERAPAALSQAVAGLSDAQLDTPYKNWSVRQIVHHLADSHVHIYIRFKWTLTEDHPTIKAYEEADWVLLEDSRKGDVGPPLALLDGLHKGWVQLLRLMTDTQYARSFFHPQTGETVTLWKALCYYPWHCRHHTGQILWLRERHGW